jgi:phosphoribosylformylglycinamidine synthase subunit PurS
MVAEIVITLKKTVSDPQGLTIKHALESLGYKSLEEVRMGKFISVRLDTKDRKKAEAHVSEMCTKLLANPIIEDFRYTILEG